MISIIKYKINIIMSELQDKRIFWCFVSSLFLGIIAHAYVFFNILFIHDGIISIFSVGRTVHSGRWSLKIISYLYKIFTLNDYYQTPWLQGLISILLLGVFSYLIIKLLNIKSKIMCISLSGLMVVFPIFASLFMFMYTAPHYIFGLVLAVYGPMLFIKNIHKGGAAPICLFSSRSFYGIIFHRYLSSNHTCSNKHNVNLYIKMCMGK